MNLIFFEVNCYESNYRLLIKYFRWEAQSPTLVNNSDYTIYYKLETTGESIPVGPHQSIYGEIDGIAAPHLSKEEVFKSVNGVRVAVSNTSVSWKSSGLRSWGGQNLTGGWKNSTYLYSLTANAFKTTYLHGETAKTMYSSISSKFVDNGWNSLYQSSGLNITPFLQPHAIERTRMIFYGSKF